MSLLGKQSSEGYPQPFTKTVPVCSFSEHCERADAKIGAPMTFQSRHTARSRLRVVPIHWLPPLPRRLGARHSRHEEHQEADVAHKPVIPTMSWRRLIPMSTSMPL